MGKAAEAKTKREQRLAKMKTKELEVKALKNRAKGKAEEARKAAQVKQAAQNAANLLPANTAYGRLPANFAKKGFLRVQTGTMTQNSYLKFPTSTIKSTDSVIGATLRLYKTGGDSGPVVVKLSSCSFKRSTLTYTSSH